MTSFVPSFSFLGANRRKLGATAALGALVLGLVALMLVPLPSWLLDLLLLLNLALSAGLLLLVLHVPDALRVSSFPAALLFATLFRLTLGVAACRLILTQAAAGQVIGSVGRLVVRGSFLVGTVVFLILTVVQFVVVAKGAERIAEVGARFILDALPGKQMAIDAELRAASIDAREASRRRLLLSRESQFYGAMDGAMRFVKGDVLASLSITALNVMGGLAVGVLERDMALAAAIKRFGLLAIGDGLVRQVTSLVLATSAALLVTRVAGESGQRSLGQELGRELFSEPKIFAVLGAFLALLGLLPGLPTLPCVVVGAGLLVGAKWRALMLRKSPLRPSAEQEKPEARFVPMVQPWELTVGTDLLPLVQGDQASEALSLDAQLEAVRHQVFQELGVPLPAPQLRVSSGLEPRALVLSLFEVPVHRALVPQGLTVQAQGRWIQEQLTAVLEKRAGEFLGIAETQSLVDELEQLAPALIRQVIPKSIATPQLAQVLKLLVEERLSIRDLRSILEALATVPANIDKDPPSLAEYVRTQLRRATTHRFTQGSQVLAAYLLDPDIEETVRQAIHRGASGSVLALSPGTARDILAGLRRLMTSAPFPPGVPKVLLTQPDIRRFVRKLIQTEQPELWVLSVSELLPEVTVRPLARLRLTDL